MNSSMLTNSLRLVVQALNATHRPGLKFAIPFVESTWCENIVGNGRPYIIGFGCIYQHPACNLPALTS